MNNRQLSFCIILVTSLLFSIESCGGSKPPTGKAPEPTVVKPVVAGQFYPADKNILAATITWYLNEAKPAPVEGHIFGLAAPHAGYQFSGPIAAHAFKLIEGRRYSTVVVMAPSHQVPFEGIALTTKDFYETPLGRIPIANDLAKKLISTFKWAKDDPRPYSAEHSLEVELPFLQTVLKDFRVLPIIIGICDHEMLSQLAAALNNMLPGDDVLFVSSTDLSHYHTYDQAVAKDAKTLKLIENMDVKAFDEAEKKGEAELCGSSPVEALMEIAKLRNGKPKIVKYANSGDTAGDKSRVVGYGAVVFTGEANFTTSAKGNNGLLPPLEKGGEGGLSDEQKKALLSFARRTIEAHVLRKPIPAIDFNDPIFKKDGAAFVTITKKGELRGCIGHIIAVAPLIKSIQSNAIAAASQDPRFPPVSTSELKDISVEISVLTPPQPLPNPLDVRVGTDGLIIEKGFNRGVLLPQVPEEFGWNKEQFLDAICQKAGLPRGSWKDANLFRFQANVFHE